MIRIAIALLATLALGACANPVMESPVVDNPAGNRLLGLAGVGFNALGDMVYVLRAGERGDSLTPECDRYVAIKRRDGFVPSQESTVAFGFCELSLRALQAQAAATPAS